MLGLSSLVSWGAGVAVALAVLGGAYAKGRWDEKDSYRDELNALVAGHAEELKVAAQRNAEQGVEVRTEIRYIERETEDIRDEIAEADGAVCPVSDERQRLLQRALTGPDGLYSDTPG